MNRYWIWIVCTAALAGFYRAAAQPSLWVDQRTYVGNVVGRVVDSTTGQGIPGAMVVLIEKAWPRGSSLDWSSDLDAFLISSGIRRGSSNSEGEFLINGVPTPYPFHNYTIVAIARGHKLTVFDQVPVLPGAVMSLECRFALSRGRGIGLVYDSNAINAPYGYSHELNFPSLPQRPVRGRTIFATREGLVGRTTANGHVVRVRDRFVALPSRRALSRNGARDFQVKLSYGGSSVVAPVWDVGPWNIRDDHWNPSPQREQWRDLPQGVPQAQAAYIEGYNRGKDGFGRRVNNPAGIDLADGTFWNDLRMRDNDWVKVEYLWSPGSTPEITEKRGPSSAPASRRSSSRNATRPITILSDILRVARVVLEPTR